MWARVIEFMLGCWLAISPFIFRHAPDERFFWTNDLACAAAVMLFALLSYKPVLDKIHLLNGGIGMWLVASAFLAGAVPPPPACQNHVVVGLLLTMFAVIPSRSKVPPRRWREFYEY